MKGTKQIWAIVFGFALVLTALGFGLTVNNFLLQAGTTLAMYAALACAWNIVGGYMGYPSFGTAAFFGFGCYAGAIAQNAGAPMVIAWLAAALAGAIFSTALGGILLRMRGHYFAIGTVAIVEVMHEISNNWEAVTGGAVGLNLPIVSGSPRAVGMLFFFTMCAFAGITLLVTLMIAHSKFGFGLRCIKQNEQAASMVGVDVLRYKVAAFAVSSALMSATGAIYASMVAFINPDDAFNILMSISVPATVMLGGAGLVLGPLVGAIIYTVLDNFVWINFISYHSAVLGLIIIGVIYFIPHGLVREAMKRRPALRLGSDRAKTA
jgi:branched-chain amino acid transport system permease protein